MSFQFLSHAALARGKGGDDGGEGFLLLFCGSTCLWEDMRSQREGTKSPSAFSTDKSGVGSE